MAMTSSGDNRVSRLVNRGSEDLIELWFAPGGRKSVFTEFVLSDLTVLVLSDLTEFGLSDSTEFVTLDLTEFVVSPDGISGAPWFGGR